MRPQDLGPRQSSPQWLEDVAVGRTLGPELRETSRLQLLAYAAASRDLNLIHHDPELARAAGLPGTIVQGTLKAAFIARLATGFAGESGTIKRLEVQYRGIDLPGAPLTVAGVVESVDAEHGEVHCVLWAESPSGERTTRATASIVLPHRPDPLGRPTRRGTRRGMEEWRSARRGEAPD
jgi:acyl dehydratase